MLNDTRRDYTTGRAEQSSGGGDESEQRQRGVATRTAHQRTHQRAAHALAQGMRGAPQRSHRRGVQSERHVVCHGEQRQDCQALGCPQWCPQVHYVRFLANGACVCVCVCECARVFL